MSTSVAQGRTKRSHFGWVGVFVLFAFVVVMSGASRVFWTRVDQRRFPWAYEESGRATLTGTWVGSLTTARGARRALFLDLRLKPLDFRAQHSRRGVGNHIFRRAVSDKLRGTLLMCGGAREQRFDLHGNELTADASRFRLSFATADSTPPDGLAPSHLRGAWDGRDSLRIEADLYLRRGVSAIAGGDDPETGRPQSGALHRASESEFHVLCGRLNATR